MSETKKPAGKAKTTPAMPKAGTVAYIGPDIPGAKQYTIYNAGLPDALKERIQVHPVFNSLVIPVGKLAGALAELSQEGSALNAIYRRACGK